MAARVAIGKLLLEKKLITQEQIEAGIARQESTGEKLGEAFISLGFVSENKLLELLAEQLHIPFVDLKNHTFNEALVHTLPEAYARRYRCIVLKKDDQGLLIGMVDPQDVLACDELTKTLKQPIHTAIVCEAELLKIIDMIYRHSAEITSLAEELSTELKQNDFDVSQLAVGLSVTDAPVVKLLQTVFEDAVQANASDIHIEPDEHILRIRQRIDGVLHEQILKEKNVAQALTLRLKLMGGLNIAEKRLPQDGRFSIRILNKNFDVRLSTLPTQFGESVVMRLLNQSAEILSLPQIGMPDAMLTRLRKVVTLPNGLLLITGPTGSGKTTTLYGLLKELNDAERKIITVEDPVEYRIGRINQVQVQAKIDLTFANVLRSVLRQDPDIIMVGELRDRETSEIAIRAALTGHFVLSTLHTNDSISSAIRMVDMGVPAYLVATVLRAVVAQRLVRRICQNCIRDHKPTSAEEIWLSSIENFTGIEGSFKQGAGCTYCHNTGYRGQVGVYELLELTTEMADALRRNDTLEFVRVARADPIFQSLLYSGLKLVNEGITTIDEMIRIMGESLADTSSNNLSMPTTKLE